MIEKEIQAVSCKAELLLHYLPPLRYIIRTRGGAIGDVVGIYYCQVACVHSPLCYVGGGRIGSNIRGISYDLICHVADVLCIRRR